jgi:hypothetical protein
MAREEKEGMHRRVETNGNFDLCRRSPRGKDGEAPSPPTTLPDWAKIATGMRQITVPGRSEVEREIRASMPEETDGDAVKSVADAVMRLIESRNRAPDLAATLEREIRPFMPRDAGIRQAESDAAKPMADDEVVRKMNDRGPDLAATLEREIRRFMPPGAGITVQADLSFYTGSAILEGTVVLLCWAGRTVLEPIREELATVIKTVTRRVVNRAMLTILGGRISDGNSPFLVFCRSSSCCCSWIVCLTPSLSRNLYLTPTTPTAVSPTAPAAK